MSDYHNKQAVDARELDLLVDGELSAQQRRGLLKRLDETPGGWRRCALAFLEAQSWRESLGAVGGELTSEQPPQAPPSPPRPREESRRLTTVLVVAAALLTALGTGLIVRDLIRAPSGDQETADIGGASAPAPQQPRQPAPGAPHTGVAPEAAPGPWRVVRVTMPGQQGQSPQSVDVPCLESEHVDGAWLRSQPLSLPPELIEALRDPRVRVRHYRQFVPLRTADGRQVVIPLERYQVQYVDDPAY